MLHNFECPKCEIVFEGEQKLFEIEIGHELLCPECGSFAIKLYNEGIKEKHVSWSTWRLGLGNKD